MPPMRWASCAAFERLMADNSCAIGSWNKGKVMSGLTWAMNFVCHKMSRSGLTFGQLNAKS